MTIFWGDSYKLYNDFIKKKHDERNWLSKFLKCDTHVPYLFLKNNQCINRINQSNPIILIPCWEPHDTQIHRLSNSHLIKKTSPKNHQQDHLFENWIFQIILWNLIFWKYFYLNSWKYFDQIKCQKSVKWWFSAKSEILNSLLTAW